MVEKITPQALRKKIFSLSGYFILSVILIHLILIPILYYTLVNSYRKNSNEQFISHSTEVAGMLTDVISSKKIDQDKQDIVNTLDSAILSGKIIYIEISDEKDKQLLTNETYKLADEFKEDNDVGQNNDNVFYLKMPIKSKTNREQIYHLKVGFDEDEIQEEYKRVEHIVALILLAYLILVVILIAAITKLIHKPIHFLRNQSKEILNGKIDSPLSCFSRIKEIKYLTEDLEKMRSSLVGLAERMQYKAMHDELTDLPNRYLFNDRLKQNIYLSERENKQLAILLLDLDRFKEINDTLGHGIGDVVLKQVSARMLEGVRESDTIARIGGDEFAFILVNVNQIIAEKIASKILSLVEPVFNVEGHTLKVGASIGISMFPQDGTDCELLMRRADVAMYDAKHNNLQISSYYPEMDSDHFEKLMLANDLRSSIKEGCFVPYFQPKVNIKTGRVCGCEILLRWNHPNLGIINPEKFIPLAERENLTGELTRWVLEEYLKQFLKIIEQDKKFQIAINVSPVDLLDSTLYKAVRQVIKECDFPATNLCIEVTENAIMKNPVRSTNILKKFDQAGIVVSIDDFGTGYSSLAYLQKFPISELKIDKSFIKNLTSESTNYPIVTATITMAHDLGMKIVAEGVETEAVLEMLEVMGCDMAQGYHLGRPMDIESFKQWYSSQLS